jgi:hypothetical protein
MEHQVGSVTVIPAQDAVESLGQSAPSDPPHRPNDPTQITRRHRRSLLRRLASEGGAVYVIALAIYLVVAYFLDFKYTTINGDAFSRMANGFYILYSRDPHLAAIGFGWQPLTSISDMVFLLGNHLWPALAHNDMAGSLTSATFMAGAGYQLLSALREWGLSRVPRLVLTTFFILNPMIVFYGGNGMSEGLYLFTLVSATRYLLRWVRTDDLRSLAYAAVALGFSYLTRNEATGAIVAGTAGVALVSYWRNKGRRSDRTATALADAAIFAVPGVIAIVGWAVTSYVIVGVPFETLAKGNEASRQAAAIAAIPFSQRANYVFHAITTQWPLIPVVLVIAVIVAIRRHDSRILAPLTVLGGALSFDVLLYVMATGLEPYYRYFIVTIPLEILMVGSVVVSVSPSDNAGTRSLTSTSWSIKGRGLRCVGAVLVVLVLTGPSVITTAAAMFNPNIGPEEAQQLGFIFDSHPSASSLAYEERYSTILKISSYFEGLHLPNGDVIVDNSTGCIPEVITTSSRPKIFVIPNDRDFQRELADPLTFHAHYILDSNPSETPAAPNIIYPTLWNTGDGFAKAIHHIPARGTCPEFRLFRVFRHPNQA